MKGQVQLESKTALFAVSYCDDNSPIATSWPGNGQIRSMLPGTGPVCFGFAL